MKTVVPDFLDSWCIKYIQNRSDRKLDALSFTLKYGAQVSCRALDMTEIEGLLSQNQS